jgi:hypothetical protein
VEEVTQAFASGRERCLGRGSTRLGIAAGVAALVCAAVVTLLLVLGSSQGPPQSADLSAGRDHRLQQAAELCPINVEASVAAGAAAEYLGLTRAQLRAQFRAGKSLAQIASQRQISVDGLTSTVEDAVKRDVRARLDAAVRRHRITQTEASRMMRTVPSRIDEGVNRMVYRPRLGMTCGGPGHISGPPSS